MTGICENHVKNFKVDNLCQECQKSKNERFEMSQSQRFLSLLNSGYPVGDYLLGLLDYRPEESVSLSQELDFDGNKKIVDQLLAAWIDGKSATEATAIKLFPFALRYDHGLLDRPNDAKTEKHHETDLAKAVMVAWQAILRELPDKKSDRFADDLFQVGFSRDLGGEFADFAKQIRMKYGLDNDKGKNNCTSRL